MTIDIRLSGNLDTVRELKKHGLKPRYATVWVGSWTEIVRGHVPELQKQIDRAREEGVGVHVQLFFWGDSLTAEAMASGKAPSASGSGKVKTISEYWNLVFAVRETLADNPQVSTLVNIETEWNKGALSKGNANLDKLWRDSAWSIKNRAPHAKIVCAPGGWEGSKLDETLRNYPGMMRAADIFATQALYAHGRHDRATYLRGPDILMDALRRLASVVPDKPLMVTDFAFSSHQVGQDTRHPFPGDPLGLQTEQAEALEKIREHLPKMASLGVTDIFARNINDVKMSLHNYFGWAESAWGVVTLEGKKKAGYNAFVALGAAGQGENPSAEEVLASLRQILNVPEGTYLTRHAAHVMAQLEKAVALAQDHNRALLEERELHADTRAALDKAREAISAAIADLEDAYTGAGAVEDE